MVELNIKPRLGYVTFTYSTGLNYRIQGKFSRFIPSGRATKPYNLDWTATELPSHQNICLYLFSKFYSFTSFFTSVLYRKSSIKLPWEQRLLLCGMSWHAKSSLCEQPFNSLSYMCEIHHAILKQKIIMSFAKPIARGSQESNLRTTLLALSVCFFIFFSMVFSNLATNLLKNKSTPYFLDHLFQESIGCQL